MKSYSVAIVCVVVAAVGATTACSGPSKSKRADKKPLDLVAMRPWGPPQAPDLAPGRLEPETILIEGAEVLTATGMRLSPGNVLLKDGRIDKVSAEPIKAPAGARVVDGKGRFVTPGIIDTHSHLGVYATPGVSAHADGNEITGFATAWIGAEDAVWPQDPGFHRAVAGGVTTLQIIPGSANLIGGRGITVKSHPGISTRSMRFEAAPSGLKMACGENPKRVYGKGKKSKPGTRMAHVGLWRQEFEKAREYKAKHERHLEKLNRWRQNRKRKDDDEPNPPDIDWSMETLAAVLDGDILVHVHCYRADDMMQVVELAHEFGFQIRSFHHAVEAYKIRDVLAAWDISVSTWADWWGFKLEAWDAIVENAGLVHEAGGRAIIHSDSAIGIQRLNQEAAKAYYAARAAGIELSDDDALQWITANPAWALGVLEHTGTLEEGKMADVVVWDGHPFSVYTRAELVIVDGVVEWDVHENVPPWSDFEVGILPTVIDRSLPKKNETRLEERTR